MKKDQTIHHNNSGQTFLEYTLLFGIVVMVIVALSPLMKRGIQATVKTVADQIGIQQCAEQRGGKDGKVEYVYTRAKVQKEKTRRERVGNIEYHYDDEIKSGVEQMINSGFSSD